MTKILVTGATGALGSATIRSLLRSVPACDVAALARDPDKASDLTALGVDVRIGDYFDKDALAKAFTGVEKLMLVSATAFTDRVTQHANVVEAATRAGVRHIVYTSIQRKAASRLVISMVTESDKAAEAAIKASGMDYTILYNCLYLDVVPFIIGADAVQTGVRVPGGEGRAPLVARADLADANATVLTRDGHLNKSYTLGASEAFSFADVAATLSEIAGRPVSYIDTSVAAFVQDHVAAGVPEPAAAFLAEWVQAVAKGEFEEVTGDLERLIGRKPVGRKAFLRDAYPRV